MVFSASQMKLKKDYKLRFSRLFSLLYSLGFLTRRVQLLDAAIYETVMDLGYDVMYGHWVCNAGEGLIQVKTFGFGMADRMNRSRFLETRRAVLCLTPARRP